MRLLLHFLMPSSTMCRQTQQDIAELVEGVADLKGRPKCEAILIYMAIKC
jgi:hypothetical protein